MKDLADADVMIDQRIVLDEMNVCIRRVIDSLPEDYRAALVLHDLEGLTAPQIAEICSCSLPIAKIRIHRARNRLREALQQQCEFYRDSDNILNLQKSVRSPMELRTVPSGNFSCITSLNIRQVA
jgi:RNA polymerase sigma-70 factor (ECF subfamily)